MQGYPQLSAGLASLVSVDTVRWPAQDVPSS